jgi:hypothetical protein
MSVERFTVVALVLMGGLFSSPTLAASDDTACVLPDDLQREVANRYPEAHVVFLSDLGADDRALFVKDHGNVCPGLSTVDFYGDGKPTIAIDLVSHAGREKKASLVVAHEVDHSWTLTRIDTADLSTPVVWNDKPGNYVDVYGNKKIRATRPVIVWCAYESWAILYAWNGSKVSKIWISD